MPSETKAEPVLEALAGAIYDDDWITPIAALRVKPASRDRALKVMVWNPYFSEAYLRNRVTIWLDGEAVFSDILFAGTSATIERPLPAREELLIEIDSQAKMVPDPFDTRERGVILKVTEPAQEAKAAKPAKKKA